MRYFDIHSNTSSLLEYTDTALAAAQGYSNVALEIWQIAMSTNQK